MRVVVALVVLAAVAREAPAAPALCDLGVATCCTSDADCSDGDLCDGLEICDTSTGTCAGGVPVICDAPPTCMIASCDPGSGGCSLGPGPDGTPCDDGDACTDGDTCAAGTCTGGPARSCDDGNPCTDDACDPATGCTHASNAAPCDDGDACTAGDACGGGSCQPGAPAPCDDGDPCTTDACRPPTGCEHTSLDGCRKCTTPADCSDGNPCTTDGCTAGVCVYTNGSASCDDGNACTSGDRCDAGACVGTPIVCTASDQCHDAGICNLVTGRCSNPVLSDGTICNDGSACTRSDYCSAGACVGRDRVVCVAADQCHVAGACDPTTGTCTDPPQLDGSSCDDGDGCTVGDRCVAGVCAGVPRSCDDGVPCTDDRCADGACRFEPADGHCDTGECVLRHCRPGAPGADASGCAGDPVGEGDACTDDGFGCTDDVCTAGACRHTAVDARCPSANACAPAACAPARGGAGGSGCVAEPERANDTQCVEDGDPCTDDACAAGGCVHTAVSSKATCDPVRPAYEHALALEADARILSTLVTGAFPAVGPPPAQVIGSATDIAVSFDLIARVLAGRAPATDAPAVPQLDTPAARRARSAVVELRQAPRAVTKFLQQLAAAQQRALVDASTARDLRKRGRDLLRRTKALRRELKRLATVTRSFAR